MADKNGIYTDGLRSELHKEQAQTSAQRYMARAHPSEVALATYELQRFKGQTEPEQMQHLISVRRGNNWELLLAIGALCGMFGAGMLLQRWFPYQWGNVPVLPSVFGGGTILAALGLKRSASFRYGLACAGAGLALGGGTVSGGPK